MIQFKNLPVEPLRITSKYGDRTEEVKNIPNATKWHDGVDLGRNKAVSGDCPILAVMDGIVSESCYNKYRGWMVILNHGNGVQTLYQHLKAQSFPVGTKVSAGQQIAVMGQTGIGAGLHLHFELRVNGKCIDPTPYLQSIPMPKQHSENYQKVQAKYGFNDETVAYLENYKYADALFKEMLESSNQQDYQVNTINYISSYKYGKEVFAKLGMK